MQKVTNAFSKSCLAPIVWIQNREFLTMDPRHTYVKASSFEANIPDIDEWWSYDSHLRNFQEQIRRHFTTPDHRRRHTEKGWMALSDNMTLAAEAQRKIKKAPDPELEELKLLPHNVRYSRPLIECEGFQRLYKLCASFEKVSVVPNMMVEPNATQLRSSYYLGYSIVTTDGTPLQYRLVGQNPRKFTN